MCESDEGADVFRKRVEAAVPPDGHVRVLSVTDRQFAKMQVYIGPERVEPEQPPQQVSLF